MSSDDERKHWRKASDATEQHLMELLTQKGIPFERINSNIIAKRSKDGLEVELAIHVWPHYRRYFNKADGISIRINTQARTRTLYKLSDDPLALPWEKIMTIIEDDLSYRLASAAHQRSQRQTEQNLAKQAQLEVPLPIEKHMFYGEIPTLAGFERELRTDGTYELTLRGTGFSREEALAIRDIAIAKLARTKPNEKIQETNPAGPA